MPAKLVKTDDALEVSLSGGGSEFQDNLAKIKEIAGRKWEGKRKVWLLPSDAKTAERVLNSLRPEVDPELVEWVKSARTEGEQDLVTHLPDDSDDLLIPWAFERCEWQPQEINEEPFLGLKAHQRALVANIGPRSLICDDLGIGKTIQALSYVAECLVRYKHDYEFIRVHEKVQGKEQRKVSGAKPQELSQTTRGNSGNNQQKEGSPMRGLRDFLAAEMHGLRPCEGPSSFLYMQMAVNSSDTRKVSGTDGNRGASQVRGSLSKLPSVEALASRPKLIVCPKSVAGVWKREIENWLGEEALVAAGLARSAQERQIQTAASEGSWLIINYEAIQLEKKTVKTKSGGKKTIKQLKQPLFEKIDWLACIFDESHRLKSRKAQQTQGAYRLDAPIMLELTGTPVQNEPAELWSLLHVLWPKEYTSYWRFYDDYVDYVEGYFGKNVIGVKNGDALRFELNKRLYRRTKDQVLDLPEKQRITIPVALDAKARKAYSEAETSFWLELEKAIDEGDKQAEKLLTAASQKLIYAIPNAAARTVRLRQLLSTQALLGGEDHSNKMDALVECISDARHKQHVVFSEFRGSCEILCRRIESLGLQVASYTGDTKQSDRTKLEEEFQQGDIDVMVGTIGAMKEGITLTAADTAHFLERAWVPAWNHQSEDRIHRISQKNCVTIYIYEAIDTVDDGTVFLTNKLKNRIVKSILPQDNVKESK